ncbi:3,4-dihydroxy-2-butanone-4-phosphate synthase [Kitasatospora cineracea]|uniref:3,4-dihydroxy-2-butanone 4-phosphate synthase n=1 Tax=Kitasatospora cineracea TaxID=88074 RepID=A0A8G1X9D1_9ACTN|nr:3,4-dihydroxy-2-butanone 4-phosphate synthase [Kitasatospora cineracea]
MTIHVSTADEGLQRISGTAGAGVLHEVPDVVDAVRRGQAVVVVDDEGRENEGDLIVAAEFADAAAVNFMITHGRGLVCTAIPAARAEELRLPPMVPVNEDPEGTAFTVSVDGTAAHGVTTGISAHERARTIELLLRGSADDLRRPGHMFPLVARDGGVLERRGHTEAAVELARLAGLAPAAVLVEIVNPDGTMARLPQLVEFSRTHGLLLTSIEKLVEHVGARS